MLHVSGVCGYFEVMLDLNFDSEALLAQDYMTHHFIILVHKALRISVMLALHAHLQRKLASEGTSFDEIKDEIRKELALQYLWATKIPMNQLANILILGFSEQSVLSRAPKC
ncbi:hypothetical protein E0H82_15960 [Acinetobacter sp. ANC 4910]|uniref:hypothetical protein n=1 Tax=Acinetobacter sp. ANC 4910 TaxID=2529850 RepID=UPI00103DA7C1|nr:hypothetical protein [Acinetobacter sp. ANC 4910]TCB31531.1 hypothetical protein E0H82_15960 [Acinetobacter sp. ANC 4910]